MKINLRVNWLHFVTSILIISSFVGVPLVIFPAVHSVTAQWSYIFLVREIELQELGYTGPAGLSYSARADLLLATRGKVKQPERSILMLNRIEQDMGTAELENQPSDPINTAFNQRFNSLFMFEPGVSELVVVAADESGRLLEQARETKRFDMHGLGVQQAAGIDFDPVDGRLFFLDPPGKRLYIVAPDDSGDYGVEKARQEGRLSQVDLKGLSEKHLNGLAFNPVSANLFSLSRDNMVLYEFNQAGDMVDSRDVSTFNLKDPQAMVFAPSGDATDAPEIQNLYLGDPGRDMIVEISITPIAIAAALPPASPISLVNTILTSNWNPPSPDPTGLDFMPAGSNLITSDSEVDEMSIYQGVNVFKSNLRGSLNGTCTTLGYPAREPNGVGVNPANGHVFISDDGQDRVFEIDLGPDGQFCTGDDRRTAINTLTFGIADPEGVGFGGGRLLVSDGLNAEIYVISPGSNGVFDGASPAGDDQATHFDTASMGLRDPEGIGYHPVNNTAFLVSRPDKIIVETDLNGSVLRVFDISFLNARSPGGLGIGPGSQNSSVINVYMSARGVDNNTDPNENDGKIFELSITGGSEPPPGPANLYLSLATNGSGSLSFARDEDILSYDGATYSLFFDGSDVGATGDVNAFTLLNSTTVLMSFDNSITLPGLGAVQDHDVVRFNATSLGSTTAGTFQMYLDGEDVGLTSSSEDIDALDLLPDGRIIISTTGGVSVTGASGADEDLLAFTPTQLGANTSGSWALYFDGSDVGLSTSSSEDTDGLTISSNGDLLLSTLGSFSVSGLSGTASDIFTCRPTSLGNTTSCNFISPLFFQGSANGLSAYNLDGFDIP